VDQTAGASGQEQELILRPRIAIVSAAALLGAAVFAWAGDPDEPDATCDGSTAEMVECVGAKTAYWDKRMNIAYQQALKEAQPEQREQLRKAQRLWIQYRDANCLYYDLGEGTIARIESADCMYTMTEARARELEGSGDGSKH
jgi:uncharacterized protein YecT (DUF1311 family)